ncbi:MAG: phage tail tape measure protein [Polyangiaceae bacterium]
MAKLVYEYDVIGMNRVQASLASAERLFAQHATRINRIVGANSNGRLVAPPPRRSFDAGGRDQQRLIDRISSSQTALARQRIREERDVARVATQGARDRQRAIDEQVRSQSALARQREREERATHHTAMARAQFLKGTVGTGANRVLGALSSVGKAGLTMTGVGGAALAATSVGQAISLDERARRLAVQGRGEGEAGRDPNELRKAFVQTGIASGIAPEQVAAGAAAFVNRTGDLDGAMANLGTFADVAQATGASIEDVARAAADMSQKLNIKSVEDMRAALALLTVQGKRGAFELKDMAEQFPEMAAAAANAGVRGVGGVRELGSIAQVAMQATGSGAEASTSVQAMFRQLAAKSEAIQSGSAFSSGKKVQVFEGGDAKKPMRNFLDVIGDVMQATGGNVVELQDIFDIRGIRAVNPLIAAYREANQKAGGGKKGDEAGRTAMQGVLSPFMTAPANYGEIQRDAGDIRKSTSIQIEVLMSQLKGALASELLPAINRIVPELLRLTPQIESTIHSFASMASWLMDNPLKGIGAVFAMSIGAEMAKAQLGTVLQQMLMRALGSGGTGGAPIQLANAAITVSGTAAIVSLAAATDQANKLDRQLGTTDKKGSIFAIMMGADEKGHFSLERFGKDVGNAFVDPAKLVGDKGGAALALVRALTGGYDETLNIEAKQRDKQERQAEADAAIKQNAELEAQMTKLSGAAATATENLLKMGGVSMPNRGNEPSKPVVK